MKRAPAVIISVLMMISLSGGNLYAQCRYDGHRCINADDYLQYVPLAEGMALGFTGIETEHDFTGRLLAGATSFASVALMVKGLKLVVHKERPDGTDFSSFPSGHSAIAFMGAEIVREEYGWWWGAGAYSVAVGTAFLRVYNGRHDVWDVLAGAGTGVLAARIGFWLLGPEKKLVSRIFGSGGGDSPEWALSPVMDFRTGAACLSLNIAF